MIRNYVYYNYESTYKNGTEKIQDFPLFYKINNNTAL